MRVPPLSLLPTLPFLLLLDVPSPPRSRACYYFGLMGRSKPSPSVAPLRFSRPYPLFRPSVAWAICAHFAPLRPFCAACVPCALGAPRVPCSVSFPSVVSADFSTSRRPALLPRPPPPMPRSLFVFAALRLLPYFAFPAPFYSSSPRARPFLQRLSVSVISFAYPLCFFYLRAICSSPSARPSRCLRFFRSAALLLSLSLSLAPYALFDYSLGPGLIRIPIYPPSSRSRS